jgi:hypothetical protein
MAMVGIALGGREPPALKADNLTAICGHSGHLRTLWVSTVYYGDNFTFTFIVLRYLPTHKLDPLSELFLS